MLFQAPIAGCEVQLTANSSIDEQSSRQGRVACYTPLLRRSTVVQSDGSKVATAVTADAVDQTVEPLAVTARPSASGSPRMIARSQRIEDKSWYSAPIHGFEVCRVVTATGPCWLRTWVGELQSTAGARSMSMKPNESLFETTTGRGVVLCSRCEPAR